MLWSAGFLCWDAARTGDIPLPEAGAEALKAHLELSHAHLEKEDPAFFTRHLPIPQQWRLFREFGHSVAYLDIETTGLGGPDDHITSIALYDGRSIRTYVHGRNLDRFGEDVEPYRLLVTYNGKSFDIPFIRAKLGLRMTHAHIDLRNVLGSLGYRGGLKGCERQLGIDRGGLAETNGYTAVLLWQEYQRRRNDAALETLLAYNVLDTVNLAELMARAYNLKLAGTPFAETHLLPVPSAPANPFRADAGLLARLTRY